MITLASFTSIINKYRIYRNSKYLTNITTKLLTIAASPRCYPSFFEFVAILNDLAHNSLSEDVLLSKSLNSLSTISC